MEEMKVKPCVGCGFCCIKSKCAAGQRLYKSADICPALIWSDSESRYYCDLMTLPGNIGFQYREELYAGAGCCCNLNTWRKDVKPRATSNNEDGFISLDPLFQKFLNHLSKEFISSDVMYLALLGLKHELIKDGNDEEKIQKILELIIHKFKSSRSKFTETFIG